MNVRELIAALEKYPADMPVVTSAHSLIEVGKIAPIERSDKIVSILVTYSAQTYEQAWSRKICEALGALTDMGCKATVTSDAIFSVTERPNEVSSEHVYSVILDIMGDPGFLFDVRI